MIPAEILTAVAAEMRRIGEPDAAEILTAVAAEMRRIGEPDAAEASEMLWPSEEIVRGIAAGIAVLKARGWGQ